MALLPHWTDNKQHNTVVNKGQNCLLALISYLFLTHAHTGCLIDKIMSRKTAHHYALRFCHIQKNCFLFEILPDPMWNKLSSKFTTHSMLEVAFKSLTHARAPSYFTPKTFLAKRTLVLLLSNSSMTVIFTITN